MRHRPTPRELWDASPWYEKLGMSLFLGIHALPFVLGLLQFCLG
jgi:hypothetical protein